MDRKTRKIVLEIYIPKTEQYKNKSDEENQIKVRTILSKTKEHNKILKISKEKLLATSLQDNYRIKGSDELIFQRSYDYLKEIAPETVTNIKKTDFKICTCYVAREFFEEMTENNSIEILSSIFFNYTKQLLCFKVKIEGNEKYAQEIVDIAREILKWCIKNKFQTNYDCTTQSNQTCKIMQV